MPIDQATLGKRLKDARVSSGLSQEAVAQELGLPRTAVVHLEAGNRSISTVELSELARLYDRRIGDFFQEALTEEQDIILAIHRLAPEFNDDAQVQKEISKQVRICQEAVELRSMLALPTLSGPPKYDLPAPHAVYEAVRQGCFVANEERRRLGLGDNPIPDMADLITTEGVWATGAHLPDQMSGMFLRHQSIGMVILVNFHHARARKRFSYAHEYAHALMDRDQSVTVSQDANRKSPIEVRANAFAAAFLMPAAGVATFLSQRNKGLSSRDVFPVYDSATELRGLEVEAQSRSAPGSQHITYQLVARLAHHFSVSYKAATYRLKALNIVNEAVLNELLGQESAALAFLSAIKMQDDLTGKDEGRNSKADRELIGEVLSLALEAYHREEISKSKLIEVGSLVGIRKDELLVFAE